MTLPKQVRDAEKRAEELLKQQQEPEPAPEQEPEVEPEQEQEPEPENDYTALKHKFDVLQGKYNAEISALKADVSLLNRLKFENKELKAQLTKSPPTAAAPVQAPGDAWDTLSQEEKEYLEMESIPKKATEIIAKLVRAKTLPIDLSAIETKVRSIESAVAHSESRSWEDQLRAGIPDLEKYFGDTANPAFVAWLDGPLSEFTRRTRRQEMQAAYDSKDLSTLQRGIALFNQSGKPAPPPKPRIEPSQSAVTPEGPVSPEKKVWKMTDVRKFYEAVSKGMYAGRDKEIKRIDKEITLAARENRVIP